MTRKEAYAILRLNEDDEIVKENCIELIKGYKKTLENRYMDRFSRRSIEETIKALETIIAK